MDIKVLEDYILKLFIGKLELQISQEKSVIFNIELDYKTIEECKKEVIYSSDYKVLICLLKDTHGRIVTVGVFNLVGRVNTSVYELNTKLTIKLNEGPYRINNILFSTSSNNLLVFKSNSYNMFSTYIVNVGYEDLKKESHLDYTLSCLGGTTGALLHDGSGLLLIGDPLQKGRVVTEENGFSTMGSILIYKYTEEDSSIKYVDEIHTHTGDLPHFNNCFIIDPEQKNNVIIYYTADGKGINTSINMSHLLNDTDGARSKLFNRNLKSKYS